jgi:rhodanese-related sulfurtransferase
VKEILIEGLLVATAGAVFAFAANWLACNLTRHASMPMGLELTRNYFPAGGSTNATPKITTASTNIQSNLEAQLRAEGLHLADSNLVARLFHDPRVQQDLVVFIDARDNEEFQQGHIPGAYLFNHYHPETYLPTVWPACRTAQQIVVYCNGGNCDESILAARLLRDLPQIGGEKLFVYAGGITEWATNGWPVELGERKSGNMREPGKAAPGK